MTRKPNPKLTDSIIIEVSGAPISWKNRECIIDGNKIRGLHRPTWGRINGEMTWYCQRCGQKLEHPLGL